MVRFDSRLRPPGTFFPLAAALTCTFACTSPRPDSQPAVGAAGDDAPPLFVEAAAASGLDFVHQNGATGHFYFPELSHAGAGWVDVDNDGRLDVYLVQSGPLPTTASSGRTTDRLYRNRGDGSFEDVTEGSGIGAHDDGYGIGLAAADYDRDGWVDLYVTRLGVNRLYHNDGPAGGGGRITFTDVTGAAGVGDPAYSSSAAFVDFDRDGDLDLYVCNYLDWSVRVDHPCLGPNGVRAYCRPAEYPPRSDTLYRNDGLGPAGRVTFTDVSRQAGIRSVAGTGLGVATADFDGDGWTDIFVANDQMANHLWMNRGDGTFSEEAMERGVALNDMALPEAGMGVVTEDFDEDGDWDLFMVHLSGETNTFYRNLGGGLFRDVTDELGLGAPSRPYTGFGTALFDFDNDGRFDIFIANGKVAPDDEGSFDYAEPNRLLHGVEGGDFEDVSAAAGAALALVEISRAAAFGDYDNDGDVDILVANNGGPVRLLRNDNRSSAHWLLVQLVGTPGSSDRDVIGARVSIETAGRRRQRLVQPAYSYTASNDPRVHFGLGTSARVDRLVVTWGDGRRSELEDVAVDRILVVRQQDATG